MKKAVFIALLIGMITTGKAQYIPDSLSRVITSSSDVKGMTTGTTIIGTMTKFDTFMVVRNISNETRSTFWRQIDHSPFPCKLMEIREQRNWTITVRYLKRMRHGWAPIPVYYKVWEN